MRRIGSHGNATTDGGPSTDDRSHHFRMKRRVGRTARPKTTLDLRSSNGHGTPSTGGGGVVDPFTVGEPVNPLDEKIREYLMAHPEGVTQNAVAQGRSRGSPGKPRGPSQGSSARSATTSYGGVPPGERVSRKRNSLSTVTFDDAAARTGVSRAPNPPGGESRDIGGWRPGEYRPTGIRGGPVRVPVGTHVTHPIGDTPSGHGTGTHLGTHLAAPNLLALAGAKVTMPPPPRGGAGRRQ